MGQSVFQKSAELVILLLYCPLWVDPQLLPYQFRYQVVCKDRRRGLVLRNLYNFNMFDLRLNLSQSSTIQNLLFVLSSSKSKSMIISLQFLTSPGKSLFQPNSLLKLIFSITIANINFLSIHILFPLIFLQFFNEVFILIFKGKQFGSFLIAFFCFLFQFST